ncbi:hypothetical protein Ddye_018053 [Dipteronia dyeriana]|uniref:Uncharacterized protein n=1 Tax=Dipteronia dyeriana TaxID=168575 RepID=A0AAD9X0E2_9ROSI|nr:hypothetical protein Ddye_018053 [Dipteronia dyeriana]
MSFTDFAQDFGGALERTVGSFTSVPRISFALVKIRVDWVSGTFIFLIRLYLLKQCWRSIQFPNSLPARVLKYRYFPDVYLFHAGCGSSSFFLWQSLVWRLELLESGSRWRIGSGDSVSIHHDWWIPRPLTFKVISPPILRENAMLSALKLPSGEWNEEIIRA